MLDRMGRMLLCGIFLGLLMNCRSAIVNYHDPAFVPYVNEFIRYSKIVDTKIEYRVKNIGIVYDEANPNHYAQWQPFNNRIAISKKAWDTLPGHAEKEELLFHELGHAVLNKDHSFTGIMKPQGMVGFLHYTSNYSRLVSDLFGCPEDCIKEDYNYTKYPLSKEDKVTRDEILGNEHAVVRFTATWCPPCRVVAPIFDEVAKENPDVKVYVIDVDANGDLATSFNIRGIPAMVKIKNQKVDQVLVGAQPKPEIEKLFKKD